MLLLSLISFSLIIAAILLLNLVPAGYFHHLKALSHPLTIQSSQGPITNGTNLKAEVVFQGLKFPTSMAFLGPNDILVLEKNDGTVNRIVNGTMLPHPLLVANISTQAERGMLGIAVAKHKDGPTYVFLYYTQSGGATGDDVNQGVQPLGNRVYRYELVNDKLVNPKLLLSLPVKPGPAHNGGKIIIGPDNNLYLVIGDLNSIKTNSNVTQAENAKDGLPPDGRGGILRMTQDGKQVGGGILGKNFPLSLYYGYGIRNSFGIAFDPVSKKLWDTENGPDFGDEINLVGPGFNSGWVQVMGIWTPEGAIGKETAGPVNSNPSANLVDFGGKGKYGAPEISWYYEVGPTGIVFLNSDKLGKQYKNDMFVGDFHQGNIYDFKLNQNRTGLTLDGLLADKVANTPEELKGIIFAHGFGGITDVAVGPDGYLYVLSLYEGGNNCTPGKFNIPCIMYNFPLKGTLFRILPVTQ